MKYSFKYILFVLLFILINFIHCDKDNEVKDNPIIIKYTITNISFSKATDGSIDVTINGGYPPYNYSWSTGSTNEDIYNLGAGSYTLTVTDQKNQSASVTIIIADPTVTDIDGNTYDIVVIGAQIWMAQNLRVTRSPEGDTILSYCYNDDEENALKYGRLYTWDVAMNGSIEEKAQGICPCSWHIPSDEEWKILEIYLGMSEQEADLENTWRGTNIGIKLKENGESDYNAMLSGRRSTSGTYSLLNQFEYIWTSSEYGSFAWRRCLDINSDLIGRWNTFPKTYAFSLRCIKDY